MKIFSAELSELEYAYPTDNKLLTLTNHLMLPAYNFYSANHYIITKKDTSDINDIFDNVLQDSILLLNVNHPSESISILSKWILTYGRDRINFKRNELL